MPTMFEETKTSRLEAFDAEIKEIDADLYTLLTTDGDSGDGSGEDESALSELDQQFAAAGLGDDVGTMSVNAFAESEADVAIAANFIKEKVKKIIKELRFLAKRYPNCTKGVKTLALALAAYRRGKWFAALRNGYQAIKAFKACAA